MTVIWQFLGADSGGIYVRLYKGDDSVDIKLPPTQDYFDTDEEGNVTSEYLDANSYKLWDAQSLTGPTEIAIESDKMQITADGQDVATVTAMIPVSAEYCWVTVNGPPAEKADIVDGQVVREFVSAEVGVFRVDFYAGNKVGTIFIEAVA
jgi:hypothetical protein